MLIWVVFFITLLAPGLANATWKQVTEDGQTFFTQISAETAGQPFLIVDAPKAFDVLSPAQITRILWRSGNGISVSDSIKITLYVSTTLEADYVQTINHAAPNLGYYDWFIAIPASYTGENRFKVKLEWVQQPWVTADSQGLFQIFNATA